MSSELHAVRHKMQCLQERLANMQDGEAFILSVQDLMMDIQGVLVAFRTKQREQFQQLDGDCDVLERGVEVVEQQLSSYCAPSDDATRLLRDALIEEDVYEGTKSKKSRGRPSGLLTEVVEFDAYDSEYGPNGNWHSDDHQEFLKILQAHRGDYAKAIVTCCDKFVGSFDRLDIIAHARWHARYEELALRKRLAMQAWRQEKDIAAAAQKQHTEELLSSRAPRTGASSIRPQSASSREHTKAVLAEWKACKAEERALLRAAKESAQQEQWAMEQARRQQRKQELHKIQVLGRHQNEHLPDHRADFLANQKKANRVSSGTRRALQERNDQHLCRRRAALEAKLQQQCQREAAQAKLLSKVNVHVPADPERIWRPTTASQSRALATATDGICAKDSGFIRHIQHKACLPSAPSK